MMPVPPAALLSLIQAANRSFLFFIFTLVEAGTKESPPVITIPTG